MAKSHAQNAKRCCQLSGFTQQGKKQTENSSTIRGAKHALKTSKLHTMKKLGVLKSFNIQHQNERDLYVRT